MNKPKLIQHRLLFLMKVTLIHLLMSSFSIVMAYAIDGLGQDILDRKVTLNADDAEFKNILLQISKQVKVKFAYSPELLEDEQKISIHVQDTKLSDVLVDLLSPEVSFKVVGKQIVLIPLRQTASEDIESNLDLNEVKITGKVTDSKGEELPGVSAVIKGTTIGTTTNSDGTYAIKVSDGDEFLIFSSIGFRTMEVAIGNRTVIDVTMEDDLSSLNEVVVTALGIKKEEKALGYAVGTVGAEQLTMTGNTNFASALYGKVAGLRITTAPGGSGSAVNVQIRGINSINYNQQPLYVVDGIMIRNDRQNGAAGANNVNFWDDQRIQGNGILDINPADIETLSVLKGASASALYGSDAASGVVVITTKKGTRKGGLGVDFNYNATVEKAAFLPKLQNVYGPGYDRVTNVASGATPEGWVPDTGSPTGFRPFFRAYGQFGPKMEGQQVKWWDGSIRSFSARPNNYRDVFDVGYSSNANISISSQTEKINYRLSATRLDYKSTNPGSTQQRNTFNFNSTIKLNDKISTDIVVSYINTLTHNRAYQLGQVLNSFGGYFSRAEDIGLMRQKFQTTDGYKYSTLGTGRPEDFIYRIRATNLLDFYWNQLRNSYDETENRLLSSATLNWEAINHFKVRGRIGNDYTGKGNEDKRYNENALAYNPSSNSTGAYITSKGVYSILYGDVIATYSNKIGNDFDYSISGGFQSRSESYKDQSASTQGGLVTENWFSISNSYSINANSFSATRKSLLKYAYLGMMNLSYKNYLFVEATARQEYASTLPPQNNGYFYPSVNSSFVFTDAFRLPSFLSYGKLRASYGIVGNAPPMYESNVAYSQQSLLTNNGSVPALFLKGTYGNDKLKSEKKYEHEFGLETRFLNNRFGIDISYYSNTIRNQILSLSTAPSNGATGQIVNVGELGSRGLEIALNAKPLTGDLKWDVNLNFSTNRSRVISLAPGIPELVFYSAGGALKLVAGAGEQLGNIYVKPRLRDSSGNLLISDDGYYLIEQTKYEKVGNIMPKAIGGLSNTFTYKGISLFFIMDYRFGGKMVSTPMNYQTSAGVFENTLEYRDAEHGGLNYTVDGVTYNDGVLLKGITQSTGEANTKIISAADYYLNTFSGDGNSWNEKGMVYDNSYIKFREAALSYKIPTSISEKLRLNSIRVSFIGRNLFYIWRTLENLDPEAPLGNKWWAQGVDVGSSAATRSYGFSVNASF